MSAESKTHSIADDVAFLREMIRSSRPRSGSEEAHDAWDDAIDRAYATLDRLVEQLEATEQHADEIRQLAHRQGETIYDMTIQLASLRHALTQVRAECDLPDYIAEFVGEALGESLSSSSPNVRKSWGPERMRHDPERA